MPKSIFQPPGLTQKSLPIYERGLTAMLLIMGPVWSVGIMSHHRNESRLSQRQVAVTEISLPANNYVLYQRRTRRINYYLLNPQLVSKVVITSGCKWPTHLSGSPIQPPFVLFTEQQRSLVSHRHEINIVWVSTSSKDLSLIALLWSISSGGRRGCTGEGGAEANIDLLATWLSSPPASISSASPYFPINMSRKYEISGR